MNGTDRNPFAANIFTDPIGWAGTMVGTKARYIFSLVFIPIFVVATLDTLSDTGIVENWSSALLIIGYHLMFVHSLRALYKRNVELEGSAE